MNRYRVIFFLIAILITIPLASQEQLDAPDAPYEKKDNILKQANEEEREETIKENEGKHRGESNQPGTAKDGTSRGFDNYPKRTYKFLFNNVLYNFLYHPTTATAFVTIPGSTIPSAITLESAYSMVLRVSDYPVNLLYDKIGTGWTSCIMLVKMTLLDFPFAYTTKVLNHEFSGHTMRFHEAGQTIQQIDIGVPLPWGPGGGATSGTVPQSIDQNIFITAAGSEANTVLAHEMSLRFVSDGVIYPFDILLYLNARFDELLYIDNATGHPSGLRMLPSGDYEQYLILINNKYGRVLPNTYRLKLGELKQWSYIALADPFLYMATGAFFYNIFTGKKYMKTFMIPISDAVSFMPSTRVVYSTNGPECYGDLMFKLPRNSVLLAYVKGSSKTLRESWGAGIRLYTIDMGRFVKLGGGLDLFSQPRVMNGTSTMFLENLYWNLYPFVNPVAQFNQLTVFDLLNGYIARSKGRMFGSAVYADLTFLVNEFFRAYLRIGYKSDGYVFGMSLKKGFFWYTGMGFNF
jgi:hypothetical protein